MENLEADVVVKDVAVEADTISFLHKVVEVQEDAETSPRTLALTRTTVQKLFQV